MKNCPMCSKEFPDSVPACGCGYAFSTLAGDSTAVPLTEETAAEEGLGTLSIAGALMTIVGGAITALSFGMKTSVATDVPYGSGILEGLTRSSEVVNIGLLQQQTMVFQGGVALAFAGVMYLAAGGIVGAIRARPGVSQL